jgi:lysophospholipase L1-like esterase
MKFLFSGDSITLGKQGVGYVRKVMNGLPGSSAENIAVNGETLNMISRRILHHLQKKSDYDFIVLAGGLGDACFPVWKEMGLMFRFAYAAQEFIGMKPAPDADSLFQNYSKLIDEIRRLSNARIIILTLNCCSEMTGFPYYKRRSDFNNKIRELAALKNRMLVDAGKAIDDRLAVGTSSSFFLGNFWTLTYSDKLFAMIPGGFDWLSHRRKLQVTFDGIHLNSEGAEIFASAFLHEFHKNYPQVAP